jgi:type IV pilus assembly protein PilN
MIKINLLPVRADKKKESAKKQLLVLAGSIAVTLLIFAIIYVLLGVKIGSTKADIAATEARIAELKIKIGKINNLEKLKADVQNKLDILSRLRKEKTGPVQRLLILSQASPDKLWVTKYVESGNTATVNGVAFDEELIANFIRGLDSSSEFSNVDLVVSEQIEMGGMKVKKFELKMNLKNVVVPTTQATKPSPQQQPSPSPSTPGGASAQSPPPPAKKDAIK